MKKPGKSTNETTTAGAREVPTDARSHTERFAEGMRLFTARDYVAACEVFESAADGPELGVNESARMYLRICRQKLDQMRAQGVTGEEHYQTGTDLLRQGQYVEALTHLETALKSGETARVRYALALAAGHIGDPATAVKHFRRACDLDPQLRNEARTDTGFQNLLQFSEFREALSERG
jgi:tetratricopeptide (TPR) repeat protein